MTITLNSLSGKLLTSLSLRFFSGVLSGSFIWNIFLCFFILLDSLCVYFYVLGKTATSPSLEGVVTGRLGCVSGCCLCSVLGVVACQELSLQLFQSCGARNASPLATRARCSRGVPCVDCAHLLGLVWWGCSGTPGWVWHGGATMESRGGANGSSKVEGECKNGACKGQY